MPASSNPARPAPPLSPKLAELQFFLTAFAESERMTVLVDYLDELRREFDCVAAELKTLGLCAPCYFSGLDESNDHNCAMQCDTHLPF